LFFTQAKRGLHRAGRKIAGRERSNAITQWYFESVSFSPNGKFVVCGGRMRFLCIYSVDSQLLGIGVAEQVLVAKLGKRSIIEAAARNVRWCMFVSMPDGIVDTVDLDVTIADAKTCTQSFAMVYVLKRPSHRS
jgi:hypothetical protein